MRKLSQIEYITKANLVHNYKYDYSKSIYTRSINKIIIICEKHGEFEQRADMHINRGDGCPLCSKENKYKDTKDFINDAIKVHGNTYSYEKSKYTGVYKLLKIYCKIHGIFEQTPNSHLRGIKCPKCNRYNKMDKDLFISRANSIHNNRYDYSLVDYKNSRSKVSIICKKHGIFTQLANNHLQNHGCPTCDMSTGETNIENFLIKNNIRYEREFKFKNLRNKYPLRFDFAILNNNNNIEYLIEFNGKQHYSYSKHIHRTIEYYRKSLLRDQMKIDYCKDNNIKLYIIRFDDDLYNYLEKIINENI